MPQDSLRSVVYRSFVTCDDPKGVVECSAIRRSKSKGKDKDHRTKVSSSTSTSCEEERIDNINKDRKTKGSSSTSTSYEEERTDSIPGRSAEELQNLSSYQIKEVSKGARKLNDTIGSWSNGTSFDKQSKFIAKDLLKGAIQLQESLTMLGKLQEASRFVAKPKKKHKERAEGLMDSNRFGDNDRAMAFQKSDRSSRDCYDELRDVIRESFARQNLLPKVSANERDFLDRKSSDNGMDFPYTSSSQSSKIPVHSSESSPSNLQLEKPNSHNLIAKLMGLEEVPSKPLSSGVYKQVSKGKLPNQRSYLVDIDLARPRKTQFIVQKAVRERRTLEEMIETTQFKGLIGRNIDGYNRGEDFSDVFLLRSRAAFEDPPIVIMKPQFVPDFRAKEFKTNYEEKAIRGRQMPRERMEEFQPSAFDVPRARLKFAETNDKVPAGITPKWKIKVNKDARLIKKTQDSQNDLLIMKINPGKNLTTKVQKKEETVEKINSLSKGDSHRRKQGETKDDKSQEPAKTQGLGKTSTLKLRKATKGSNVAKVQVALEEKTATEKATKPKSPKATIPEKTLLKSKPNSKSSAAPVENTQSDDNLPTDMETHISDSLMSAASEKIIEEVRTAIYNPIPDNTGDASSSSCESSGPTSKLDVEHIEDGFCSPQLISNEIKLCKSITNTKSLLLSSKSFLNRAKKFFDIRPHNSAVSPSTWLPDNEIQETSIVLKCAEEILECMSHHFTINSLSQNPTIPKYRLSLDQLAGEICDEIEVLRNYSKSCDELILADRLYSMLKRDLSSNRRVTGNWDSGWGNCFAVDEMVNIIEKLVLSEIVDDTVAQLMSY